MDSENKTKSIKKIQMRQMRYYTPPFLFTLGSIGQIYVTKL